MQFVDNNPKYMVISDIFRSQIEQGILRQGDKLLAGRAIAKQYNVDHRTVSAGLNVLVKEGLLERVPGRGTIIKAQIKTPIYLLIPCPDFLEENNTSSMFFRRLYRQLHLQLMNKGISVITVPLSPDNDPNNIDESFLEVIPERAKVLCPFTWGGKQFEYLKNKNCNVAIVPESNYKKYPFIEKYWKVIQYDRMLGAQQAIKLLAKMKFKKPLFVLSQFKSNTRNAQYLELINNSFPNLAKENIIYFVNPGNIYKYHDALQKFKDCFYDISKDIDFDVIFMSNNSIISIDKSKLKVPVISNSQLEVLEAPEFCHYKLDMEELAKMAIEAFNTKGGKIFNINPHLYNKKALSCT